MTLRHIKPKTPEWQEATGSVRATREESFLGQTRLDPEKLYKLRQILAMEQALMGMPSPWAAATRAGH